MKEASTELPAKLDPFPYSEPNTNKLRGAPAAAPANAASNCPVAVSYTSILYVCKPPAKVPKDFMKALLVTLPLETTIVIPGPSNGTFPSAPGEGNIIVLVAPAPEVAVS